MTRKKHPYTIHHTPYSLAGFTLIEVLVAATIISVIVAIGVVSYTSTNRRSRDVKRQADIEQLRQAAEMYRADNGYYPAAGCSSASCSFTNVSNLASELVPTYMPAIPSDPQGVNPYMYRPSKASGAPLRYYRYCLSALVETTPPSPGNTCLTDTDTTLTLPANYNYGVRNP